MKKYNKVSKAYFVLCSIVIGIGVYDTTYNYGPKTGFVILMSFYVGFMVAKIVDELNNWRQ